MRPPSLRSRSLEELLSEVTWLQQLPSQAREAVIADAYETSHVKGETVVRMGDASSSWIGVAEGLLKVAAVDRGGRVIMLTGVPRGSWIGEGAVVKRELRRYDIVAMRESRLIHVPSSTFRWLLDTSVEFNHVVISHLNERLSQFIAVMEIDRLDDPVSRVAKILATIFNPVLYPRMSTGLPMSQSELGELVGLTRQSISNALKRLEREGLVTTEYGAIELNDIAGLRDYHQSSERAD
jgi:CRP-like cAMP-binding protein